MPGLRLEACSLMTLLALSGLARACSCFPPIDAGDMRVAKHAVVVRVTATAVPPDDDENFGIALVKVLDRLRGNAAPKQLRYSLGYCCPLRIEAGRDYIVFSDRSEHRMFVNFGNLVAVPGFAAAYDRTSDGRYWRKVLAGKQSLPDGHMEWQMDMLNGTPRPPPPP